MVALGEEQLGDIVGRLYEAALDASKLGETGACLREATGVGSSIMFACDDTTGAMRNLIGTSANFDESVLADYRTHYHACNPWYHRGRTRRGRVTMLGEDLIREDEFRRTEFASDFCRRIDIHHTMGSIRQLAPGVVVGTGLHRTRRQGAFGENDLRLYSWLADHLGRALQIANRFGTLEGQRLASLDTLHAIGVGVVLLDRTSRPVFLNAVAEKLVSEARWLAVAGRTLQPVHRPLRRAFAAVVAAAAKTSSGTVGSPGRILRLVDPIDGGLPVTIAPFCSPELSFGPERPVALVQFADPDRSQAIQTRDLRSAYGLSLGEARLVAALVGGASLKSHASDCGISVNTVRTQLARVFAKTETGRQQELIAKVISDLSLIAQRSPFLGP